MHRIATGIFIEEGAFVFIFARRQEALDAAVAELGPNARAVRGSVSDLADLDRLYAAVKAERGTLDIVFANAGVGSQLRLGKITAKHVDETTGAPAFTAYSASKAAVRNLARAWAEDLKGTGIRVNVLSPGAIATELAREALGEEGLKAYRLPQHVRKAPRRGLFATARRRQRANLAPSEAPGSAEEEATGGADSADVA